MRGEIKEARGRAAYSVSRLARTLSERLNEIAPDSGAEADATNMAIALKSILKLGPEHIDGIHALARGAVAAHDDRVGGRSP